MTDEAGPGSGGPSDDSRGGSLGTGDGSASGTTEVWTGDESGSGATGGSGDVPRMYRDWRGPDRRPTSGREWVRWAWTVETGPVMVAREVLTSAGFVVGVGLLLFAISGVWPPMVAVQSGSMEPHMHRGDLVFIVEEGRFAGQGAVEGTGVVTYRSARSYDKFGAKGDVVVYEPDGKESRDPIIHRARFWVEDGENWYDEADKSHVRADSCEELLNCPAPNEGFITKGDNPDSNRYYDQAQGMSKPVKPAWVKGKAMVRVPWLGLIRLEFAELSLLATELGRGLLVAGGFVAASRRLDSRR